MSTSDELEKLADLKNRGIVTEAEFEVQKKSLLSNNSPKKRRWPIWNWMLAFALVTIYLGYQYGGSVLTPACDSSDAKKKVVEILNKQVGALFSLVGANGLAPKVLGLDGAKALSYDQESGFRACLANTRIDGAGGSTGYTIEWSDKQKGEYQIQIVSAEALIAQYSKPKNTDQKNDAAPDEHNLIATAVEKIEPESTKIPQRSEDISAPLFTKNEGYASVRMKMIEAGWEPFHSENADTCLEHNERCHDRPEMEACTGTGEANCKFLWKKLNKITAVCTIGEDATFDNICSD
ncbi:SHOCT domain-containing protein [Glaciimonas sp. GNP009]